MLKHFVMFDQLYLIETDRFRWYSIIVCFPLLQFLIFGMIWFGMICDPHTPAAVCGSQSVPASQECWLQLWSPAQLLLISPISRQLNERGRFLSFCCCFPGWCHLYSIMKPRILAVSALCGKKKIISAANVPGEVGQYERDEWREEDSKYLLYCSLPLLHDAARMEVKETKQRLSFLFHFPSSCHSCETISPASSLSLPLSLPFFERGWLNTEVIAVTN